jgi:putative transposase
MAKLPKELTSPFKDYVKDRLNSGNPLTGNELQDIFKDVFSEFFQQSFEAELDNHLGYPKHSQEDKPTSNRRNGYSTKNLKSEIAGKFPVKVPRDRNGDFCSDLLGRYETDISEIDSKIISMYAKGMSTSAINSHIEEIYKFSVSKEQISKVTDKLLPMIKEWQNRPLEKIYTITFLDGMSFNVRENGKYIKKTVYVIIGIKLTGHKDLLGIWIGENETSKYWLKVMNDLRARGVEEILIACVDGLNGFNTAIKAVYEDVKIQRCIVHIIRNCTAYVSYKDRKSMCKDMKSIYGSNSEEEGLEELENFNKKWGDQYPYAAKIWKRHWDEISTMYEFSSEIRRLIYTTNAVESFNSSIKRITKTKGSFPTENALLKLTFLAARDIIKKWTMPIRNWNKIFNQLSIHFEEKIEKYH